ncbi:MAG TPA: succinate dehydrogenase, hydrophobic membrane anchor protein [Gammaproteobacteria bacterium]|nr:succinate dehydrogenase, hydrophobic membrane anchor protein [Gammaproteobacteria bacterium]
MSRQAGGLWPWMLQRISAIYVAIFTLYFIAVLLFEPLGSYEPWRAWVAAPFNGIALLLFFVSLLLHAWVGVRDVLIDYVRLLALRIFLLSLFALCFTTTGLWVMQIVFGVMQ